MTRRVSPRRAVLAALTLLIACAAFGSADSATAPPRPAASVSRPTGTGSTTTRTSTTRGTSRPPQEFDSLYYKYPAERRIPVYRSDWHNFYPRNRPYHSGHHFLLDVF